MVDMMFSAVGYSGCAMIALMAFAGAFFAVGARTAFASRSETDRQAAIPLSDDVETPRDV